ncbi:MAG: hypothetical protein O7B99_05615 [Planctomycetota bacterium]|nr:hypothetical protein [Planctomycetota bacterium]
MTRLTIGTLLSVALAALLAWRVGGDVGVGILGGFLLGASLSGFGIAWQLRLLRTSPRHVFRATVVTFLLKLGFLMGAALVLRFFEPLARHADWRAFLVAFAAGVLIVMPLGSLEALRLLKERRAA